MMRPIGLNPSDFISTSVKEEALTGIQTEKSSNIYTTWIDKDESQVAYLFQFIKHDILHSY